MVPQDRVQFASGLILRTEKSVLFVIPWPRHWIVGTTDTPWTYDKAHPLATAADIDDVLNHVNEVLRTPMTYADVEGVYAGRRLTCSPASPMPPASSRASTSRPTRHRGWSSWPAAGTRPTG